MMWTGRGPRHSRALGHLGRVAQTCESDVPMGVRFGAWGAARSVTDGLRHRARRQGVGGPIACSSVLARAHPYGFEGGACLRRKSASPTPGSVRFPGALRWSCSSCRGLLDHPGPPISELTPPESQVRQEGGKRRGAPSLAAFASARLAIEMPRKKKSRHSDHCVLPSPSSSPTSFLLPHLILQNTLTHHYLRLWLCAEALPGEHAERCNRALATTTRAPFHCSALPRPCQGGDRALLARAG